MDPRDLLDSQGLPEDGVLPGPLDSRETGESPVLLEHQVLMEAPGLQDPVVAQGRLARRARLGRLVQTVSLVKRDRAGRQACRGPQDQQGPSGLLDQPDRKA